MDTFADIRQQTEEKWKAEMLMHLYAIHELLKEMVKQKESQHVIDASSCDLTDYQVIVKKLE